jgi:hypothetical protein
MAATFVGTAINSKVLRSTSQNIETNGLVTLEETYTVKTSSAQSIIPRTDTSHSSFSSATTKYANMLVESSSLKEELGGLSTFVVNYAGLLSSVLSAPVIRKIPIAPSFRGSQEFRFGESMSDIRVSAMNGTYAFMIEDGPELQIEFLRLTNGTYLPRGNITRNGLFTGTNSFGVNYTQIILGETLPAQINGVQIAGAGTTSSSSIGYVLMNEEVSQRGGCIIVLQIYRKITLGSPLPPAPVYIDPTPPLDPRVRDITARRG